MIQHGMQIDHGLKQKVTVFLFLRQPLPFILILQGLYIKKTYKLFLFLRKDKLCDKCAYKFKISFERVEKHNIFLYHHVKDFFFFFSGFIESSILNQQNCYAVDVILFFRLCLFPGKWFLEIIFQTFLYLFAIRKVGQRKTLSNQRKIWLGFQESVFLKNLDEKHFPEVVKNLEMSYYLLIISNLVLKLLIDIYIYFVLNIYFLTSSLKI